MRTERLLLQIGRVSRDGEDTESVGVAQTALPALDSNDYSAGLDDVELECRSETEADTVIDLGIKKPWVSFDRSITTGREGRNIRLFAIGELRCPLARGTRRGRHRGGGGSGGRSARCG